MSSKDAHENGPQKLARVSVPELDAVLGRPFPVLDHGFIRVIDYMGADESIVQAARVSYGTGTRSSSDDVALIRYLLRHAHTTPFEMCEIKLHVKLPIFVARQWIRHRTANVNEYSGRYSIIDNEFYVPSAEAIAPQSHTNRQGRTEPQGLADQAAQEVQSRMRTEAERSYSNYQSLLAGSNEHESGIARELARIGLGVNFYTQWYWKTDLHNLLHFLKLRADVHAQYEIRQYANVLLQILQSWVPATYQAFLDYQLHAVDLSSQAFGVVKRLLSGVAVDFETSGLSKREWEELHAELNRKT
jgi:thymidylate synthase (FAD)